MASSKDARRRPRVAGPSTRGMRSCIGCRQRALRESLIRLVCDPEGTVVVDRHLKAPGRGAHLCYDAECIRLAAQRKAFGRAFKRSLAPVDPNRLIAEVGAAIEARIRDRLAIGRRAGWTRSGMDVLARVRPKLSLIVLAEDASAATAERIASWGDPEGCPVIVFGDRALLGATQGQAERVAVGVVDAGQAALLRIEFERRGRVLVAA